MAQILTEGSTVSCPHPTGVVTMVSNSRLSVAKAAVLVEAAPPTTLGSIVGCTVGAAGALGTPCLTVDRITAGRATRLSVRGRAVLLDTLAGNTNGTPPGPPGPPLLPAIANQTRLSAI